MGVFLKPCQSRTLVYSENRPCSQEGHIVKNTRLILIARIVGALIFFGLALFTILTQDEKGLFITAYILGGLEFLLYGKWRYTLRVLWALLRAGGKKADARATKVMLETRCRVQKPDGNFCTNMADYVITTSVYDIESDTKGRQSRDINCCKQHHPWPNTHGKGELAHETASMLKTNNASVETCTYIHLRYRIGE